MRASRSALPPPVFCLFFVGRADGCVMKLALVEAGFAALLIGSDARCAAPSAAALRLGFADSVPRRAWSCTAAGWMCCSGGALCLRCVRCLGPSCFLGSRWLVGEAAGWLCRNFCQVVESTGGCGELAVVEVLAEEVGWSWRASCREWRGLSSTPDCAIADRVGSRSRALASSPSPWATGGGRRVGGLVPSGVTPPSSRRLLLGFRVAVFSCRGAVRWLQSAVRGRAGSTGFAATAVPRQLRWVRRDDVDAVAVAHWVARWLPGAWHFRASVAVRAWRSRIPVVILGGLATSQHWGPIRARGGGHAACAWPRPRQCPQAFSISPARSSMRVCACACAPGGPGWLREANHATTPSGSSAGSEQGHV